MSQVDLACDAQIQTKSLAALESGRETPSLEILLHLAERLNVPLRQQNALLVAAGYAPLFQTRAFSDLDLTVAHDAVEVMLNCHEPNPAVAVDRHWTVITANKGFEHLIAGADPLLLRPPINLLRLTLHPAGLAPRIINLREWRDSILARLHRQVAVTGDTQLTDLIEEILDYPLPRGLKRPERAVPLDTIAVPFRLVTIDGELSFLTASTVFTAPTDVTLSEVSIETFFPMDAETVDIMHRMADGSAISRTGVRPATVG